MGNWWKAAALFAAVTLTLGQALGGCSADSDATGSSSGQGGSSSGSGGAGGSCVASTELCDGIDNNCDGQVDEDCSCSAGDTQACYSGDPALLGIGECQEGLQTCDLQGSWGACEDEGVPTVEACDGLDNDCNGDIDEGQPNTTCGLGICQTTVEGCQDGQSIPCVPGDSEPPEDCDGLDDDCDGDIDETCTCTPADTQNCYSGSLATRNVGACHDGTQTCNVNDTWDPCVGDATPQNEICDGLDNDCDGEVDESCACSDGEEQPCYNGSALTRDVGSCHDGTQLCSGEVWGPCEGDQTPEIETCNALDDNCDGDPDDGDPGSGAACDTGLPGPCGPGHEHCVGGAIECVQDGAGTTELCDGIDNDCNAGTPDGSGDPGINQPCDGADNDLCDEGVTVCVNGGLVCDDQSGDSLDVCDGSDNDCDPASQDGSEDSQLGAPCDGPDSDLCQEGNLSCSGGALVCSDNTGSTLDLCNGGDDDCDPASADGDEDPQNNAPCDGPDSDLCQEGTRSCVAGSLVCNDNTGSTLDMCNGADDDCDPASSDGSEDPQNGQACDGPDSDLCLEGTNNCANGVLVCSDASGSTLDICNGADDDCDPASADGDEDPQNGASCDGPDSDLCLEGTRSCSSGSLVCSDATGSTLDLCNGADDDCDPASSDGSEDPQNGQACDGADSDLCLEGTNTCSAGALVCSDASGSTLDICNGADDDCDPASADGDEDPQNGASCDGPDSDLCLEGTRSCSAGALVCSDNSGSTLDICNGSDDDCDPASGDGDEDPQNGASCDGPDSDLCLEGSYSCSGGALLCSDSSTSTIDTCNGIDDDCDPASSDGDEDPQNGTSCDGPDGDLCQEGTRSCSAGALVCSDATSTTVDICNGADDDCDPASSDGSEDPQNGNACDGPDSDLCQEGSLSCSSGSLVCSDFTSSTLDICNNLDDDCDPASVDGSEDPQNGSACDGPDGDLCQEGTLSCSGGSMTCSDSTGTTFDICNGLDDDCDPASGDGAEDPLNGDPCDGSDTDLCIEGVFGCSGGSLLCSDNTGNDVEVCNGLDDDCNGLADYPGELVDGDGDNYLSCNDCNDGNPNVNPGATEICNGIDDNCNGPIDQAEVPVNVMCAAVPNGTRDCDGVNGCIVSGCIGDFVDTNGVYGDGCECLAQPPLAQGVDCANAISLGSLTDALAQSTSVTGNTPVAGRSVWYVISGIDDVDTNGDEYHFDGRFTSNPGGVYRMQVYRGGCGGTQIANNEATSFDWYTDFNRTSVGCTVSSPCGEGNCSNLNLANRNICNSDTSNYYVRVYHSAGAATCSAYTIAFSNGVY